MSKRAAGGLICAAFATIAVPTRGDDDAYEPPPSPPETVEARSIGAPAGAPTPKSYEVELGGRAGYASAPIRGGPNPFGAGFGGRFGVAFSGVYIGATLVDFLGASDVDVSYRALLYGVEAGYGVRFRAFGNTALTLRPLIGVGNAVIYYTDPSQKVDVVTSASGSSSSGSDTISVNNIYVQPSFAVMLSSDGHFAALAANALVLPNITYGGADPTTWISFGLEAQLGFQF